ncbi:MAG: sodium:solute symporter [Myxococcales bacterium]|nr:sodium:solute symporter [Myxococcales bacterium]
MGTGTLATVDLAIVIGFLVVVTIVGYVMSKAASGGLDDYFLGGNKIPWWVLGISTSTSNFDMAGTMIIVAVVFGLGLSGFLVEIRGGVGLSLAFLLVFLGKWLRRSRVMTSAEWMKLRFGTDTQGKAAHLLSAIANIVLSLGMIIYFAKGAGKFLTHFLPFSEFVCTTGMVTIGLFYTLMSGLYGVVFTDVIQMILLTFTAIYVSVLAFELRPDITLPDGFLNLSLANPDGLGASLLAKDPGAWEPILQMFGVAVMMWLARTVMEGMGGVGGYTDQRFFAARSEREASLLTLEAIVLSAFRWTMVAGLVVMGYKLLQDGGAQAAIITADAENVLPVVLSELLPTGVKGLVVAGLIAAAMSTFDSTLNAGASYLVKDVYESYINRDPTPKQLLNMSRYATAGLCVAGVGIAAIVPNINEIWGLITMGIGAGMFVPLFLRWYWPRFNGYGFAGGTAAGLVAALVFNTGLQWPLYLAFPSVVGSAFLVAVITALVTAPTPDERLVRFYLQINPWGLWGRVSQLATDQGKLTPQEAGGRLWEKINDVVALCFAVPFQVSLLIASMALIFHDWGKFVGFGVVTVLCAVGLYFFWFRNLKDAATCAEEDAYWAEQGRH